MTVKDGWTGRYFEDFEVGDIYRHPLAAPSARPTTPGSPC